MNSSEFIDNLKQLFNECDVDQNGCLTRKEFAELCAKIGLSKQTSDETFNRLDTDKNDRITIDEFMAGFNQYKQMSPPTTPETPIPQTASNSRAASVKQASSSQTTSTSTTTTQPLAQTSQQVAQQQQITVSPAPQHSRPNSPPQTNWSTLANSRRNHQQRLSPVASRAFKSGSNQVGVLSLGSSNGSSQMATSRLGSSGDASGSGDFNSLGCSSTNSPMALATSGSRSESADLGYPAANRDSTNMIVYSSDMLQQENSSQLSSLLSNNGSQSTLNMQDLLDCVQKLQEENQILSQIFFKDKREREEYISQLGEEFDQQVRAVEERANKKAKEELENEKKRLRDMMKAERETLQHHYKTIERMGSLIKATKDEKGRSDDGAESIDAVKSKLEDTFLENRQLKRSLQDTKTDVAMIWKEMEKLKRQYEEKLSSAYERNQQTKNECDHIKQQLNLMKDSNKKLQDASDVITNYITDRVDPVIKIATGENGDQDGSSLIGHHGYGKLALSQANSRRGSVLSDYLGNDEAEVELSLDSQCLLGTQSTPNQQSNSLNSVELESLANQGTKVDESDKLIKSWLTLPIDKMRRSKSQQSQIGSNNSLDSTGEPPRSMSSLRSAFGRSLFVNNSRLNLLSPTQQSKSIDCKDIDGPKSTKQEPQITLTKSASLQTDSDDKLIEPADGPSVATYDLILVGDSFVGKSSLASRFVEGSYVKNVISTTSIDFKTKDCKVDGVNYTINLWDTA